MNITGGTVKINAKDDAIDSIRSITINNADVRVKADGQQTKCEPNGVINIAEGCLSDLE